MPILNPIMPILSSQNKALVGPWATASPLPIMRRRGTMTGMKHSRISMNRRLLAMIGLALTAMVFERPAAARLSCPAATKDARVDFVVERGIVKTHTGFSQAQIQRRSGAHRQVGSRIVGLTSTVLSDKIVVGVEAVPAGGGKYCGYLKSIEYRLGYDKITVYVAREFRGNRCKFDTVMAHENRHVAIFRGSLDDYAPEFETLLNRIATTSRPKVVRSENEAARRFLKDFQRLIQPLFRKMTRARDRANAAIDTPQNYRDEQSRCEP